MQKLYHSDIFIRYLNVCLHVACDIFNTSLNYKKYLFDNFKISISKNDLQKYISNLRNSDGYESWLTLDSQVVQQIIDRIYLGYSLFFKNLKSKKKRKVKPPKFKKYHNYKSITFKQSGYKFYPDSNKLRITIGDKHLYLKYFKTREILGNIKTVTIKRNKLGEYFIYFTTDYQEFSNIISHTGKRVGFDFGLKTFLVGSDGLNIFSPFFFNQYKNKISKLSQKISSKKRGSKNQKKARKDLARCHKKIANLRNNFHWHLANELVKSYDVIFLENLNLEGMKKRFGRKIFDLGFYDFVLILEYVFMKHEKEVVKIDRYYPSSKRCSKCGNINQDLVLRDRDWKCSVCGTFHNRDFNASINILNEGLRLLCNRSVGASTDKIVEIRPEPSSGNQL